MNTMNVADMMGCIQDGTAEHKSATALLNRYTQSALRVLHSKSAPLNKVELIGQLREDLARDLAALFAPAPKPMSIDDPDGPFARGV